MLEKFATIDSATTRTALAALSVTRLGAAAVAGLVAYFVFVVPDELAVLLSATMVASALAGLVPLAVVYAVVRLPL